MTYDKQSMGGALPALDRPACNHSIILRTSSNAPRPELILHPNDISFNAAIGACEKGQLRAA